MEEKRKNYWFIYALLPLSFAFKNLFASGTTLALMPYYYGALGADFTDGGLGFVIFGHAFLALMSAALCLGAIYILDSSLRRVNRAFMPARDFIAGVALYASIANAILGVIGLLYFLNPLIFVFSYEIFNLIVYAAVFFVMFLKMKKVIPEYMVAKVFGTLAVPVLACTAVYFLMGLVL